MAGLISVNYVNQKLEETAVSLNPGKNFNLNRQVQIRKHYLTKEW